MQSIFSSKSIIITLLTTILTPNPALSIPSFDSESASALSLEIGGLQAEIKEARKLNLKPSDISYNNGFLHAKIGNQQRKVKIDPKIVKEAVGVVEKNDTLVFQVSIDQTQLGQNKYVDEALQGTKIGKLFLDGDIGFADIVQGKVPLPEPKPRNPYQEMLFLLEQNAEYGKFPTQWENPPTSWPQIYLRFDPIIPGLISTEFKPQVIFNSPHGQALEVNEQVRSLGERPYLSIVEDVKKRPLAYRKISPSLELAASITAALGLLEAACPKPKSCKHLYHQAKINSQYSQETKDKQKIEQDPIILSNKISLTNKWKRIKYTERKKHLSSSPESPQKPWIAAYDSLQLVIRKENYASQLDLLARELERESEPLRELAREIDPEQLERESEQLERESEPFRELAKQQFLNNPIPNHPPLLAASAVVSAWNGEEDTAKKKLNQALKLSDYPKDNDEVLDRVSILEMGLYISRFDSGDTEFAHSIRKSLDGIVIEIYEEFDKYLEDCLVNLEKCSNRDLRKKESFISSIPLKRKISRYDIAWLHGRINYLIGIQLPEIKQRKDRLRFLSFYISKTRVWNRWKLTRLETDFRKILGMSPRPINLNCKSLLNYIYIVFLITIFLPKSVTLIKKFKHPKKNNEDDKVWINFVKKIGIRE